MIMPGLLIQKDSLNSKSKENSFTLKRRLSLMSGVESNSRQGAK